MSTRSLICKENPDHTYTGIYCHWDGYPSHNGAILASAYTDREKVEELLKLGDISSLGEVVAPNPTETAEHTFDNPIRGVCVAYHRDRGEELIAARTISFPEANDSWCEYMYIFGLDGKWRFFEIPIDKIEDLRELPSDIVGLDYYHQTSRYSFNDILTGV